MRSLAALLVVLLSASSVQAQSFTFTVAWDQSPPGGTPDTTAVGYLVNIGTESGFYPLSVNVGDALIYAYAVPADGRRYFFAVSAFNFNNFVGQMSAEVSGLAGLAPPPPPPPTPSPDGTTVFGPTGSLVGCDGALWSFGAPYSASDWLIARNGAQAANGAGSVLKLLSCAVWALGADHATWWRWNDGSWGNTTQIEPGTAAPPPPPPPPPPSSGCLTGGTLAPIGSLLSQTLKNGDVDAFIAARTAEGWALLSRRKVRNLTTVSMECRGL
jgi:hypothetical protein